MPTSVEARLPLKYPQQHDRNGLGTCIRPQQVCSRGHDKADGYAVPSSRVYGPARQYTDNSIAIDYAQDRIHVNALCPGYVKTPMIASMIATSDDHQGMAGAHPWNALGEPEDVADAALFLASDEA